MTISVAVGYPPASVLASNPHAADSHKIGERFNHAQVDHGRTGKILSAPSVRKNR